MLVETIAKIGRACFQELGMGRHRSGDHAGQADLPRVAGLAEDGSQGHPFRRHGVHL
jgi:hypothetical protein